MAPKNVELLREENLKKIESMLAEVSHLAATCGLTKKDILDMIDLMEEGDDI